MYYIDCKKYAQEILDKVRLSSPTKKLIILTAGDNPASESYVKGKIKDCKYCGIPYEHIKVNSQEELFSSIYIKNMNAQVGGIIVQLPLPNGWSEDYFTHLVRPSLDVDGFLRDSKFKPCTPEGIMYLLEKECGDLTGKTALVIGRGKLVGEPIAKMLIDADCTVTIAHSKTVELDKLLSLHHDIVISAVGKEGFIDLTKTNADIMVDVGVNRNKEGKLCGDCFNFEEGKENKIKVTPVPGGVGLLTRAMLMKHVAGI